MNKFVLFAFLFTLFSIFASSLPLEGDEDTSSDFHPSKVEKARIKEQATMAKRSADDKPKERISRKIEKNKTKKGKAKKSKTKRSKTNKGRAKKKNAKNGNAKERKSKEKKRKRERT